MENEKILVLDFGGQYNQLIARRVRDLNVYCELKPCTISIEKIKEMNPKGIIFTGGPNSVYDEKAPHIDPAIFKLGIPILGICYGCQLIAYTLGGEVKHAETREYGKQQAKLDASSLLFKGIKDNSVIILDDLETFYYSTTLALLNLCKKVAKEKSILKSDSLYDGKKVIKNLIDIILKSLKA